MAVLSPSWRRACCLLLACLLLYVLMMLASAPAWLMAILLPQARAAEWQGSLWQGSVSQLVVGDQTLTRLGWQWQFPLHWQLSGEGAQLSFSTRLSPGLTEHRLSQLTATARLNKQPLLKLSASLVRFNANACLQADNLHWELIGSARQVLAGRADTEGLLYCDESLLKLEADQLRLAIGLNNYQPVIRQRWVAPQYRGLLH